MSATPSAGAATPTLLVEPRDHEWVVRREGVATPLSEHGDAGAATLAACERARRMPDARVLVHDRYHRVRVERSASGPEACP